MADLARHEHVRSGANRVIEELTARPRGHRDACGRAGNGSRHEHVREIELRFHALDEIAARDGVDVTDAPQTDPGRLGAPRPGREGAERAPQ